MKTFDDYNIRFMQNGEEWVYISCPQCSGQRKKKQAKCLSVNTIKEYWVCHHCGWTGSLQKGQKYVDPAYAKPDYIKPRLVTDKADLPEKVLKFFLDRGISQKTLVRNKITVGKIYMPQVEKHVNAIAYPYYRNDELINIKWRDLDKNFRLETKAERILYGLDDIASAKSVIWVEGENDKLALEEAGFKNVVSPPTGAPSPEAKNYSSKFDYLESAEEVLKGKKHILFVDNDEAGKKLESELARRLGIENCSRVCLPVDIKDANDFLKQYDAEQLQELVNNAKPFPVSGIHEGKSLYSNVMQLHKEGLKGGVPTGWQAVTYLYSIRLGEITTVTGIPNHGKSNFLDCMLVNVARDNGWKMGLFSPENQPLERHAASLVEKYNKKPFAKLSNEYVEATMDWVHEHFYWILPDITDDWSLESILNKAKTLVYRYGIQALVIDPWNEIDHCRPNNLSETEYISQALTKIRQFARLNNVHVFIVAHPQKVQKDPKTGEYPIVNPYMISGSAHWRNKSDNCITVHRYFKQASLSNPDNSSDVDICIQKIRFAEVGRVGVANLKYIPNDCAYYERSQAYD